MESRPAWSTSADSATAPAVHGGTLTKSAARCYPWPGTNENAPACSWWSGPGLIYALRGPLAASVGLFAVWEYRDSHEVINRRDGPVNGLYGGFVFWPLPRPAGHGRKNAARRP